VIEVTVTMGVFAVVVAAALTFLDSGLDTVGGQQARQLSNDHAHIVLATVERDVRSGNVIEAPGSIDGLPGMEVRIYTQTRGVPFTCVQYRVSGGRLERRSRPPGPEHVGEWPAGWEVVSEAVGNATQSPPIPAFVRSTDRQTLTIDLLINEAERAGAGVRLASSVTGRNTKYYDTPFAGDQCD
jgi:hypothetical protein